MCSVTAQGTPLTRFRRAVERKSLLNAELAAREMGQLNLEEALSLVLLYAAADDPRFDLSGDTLDRPASAPKASRSLSELQAGVCALALLRRGGGEAAARLLQTLARN